MRPAGRATARGQVLRYMGNKAALAPAIARAVRAVARGGELVVDPMAGSHAVTRALKARYRILGSDAQDYAATVGRAFVDNTTVRRADPAFVSSLRRQAERRLASPEVGFLESRYADTYLGARQCRQLDALRAAVDVVAPGPGDPRRHLALCALMTAACRGQASPGHFAQFLPPDHPRTAALRRIDMLDVATAALASWKVTPGVGGSRSLALPWRRLVAEERDALRPAAAWYVDPPYTRDQYSRFYHLLETIVRGDRPAVAHRARYRDDRFSSAFCSSRRAAAELGALLLAIRDASPSARVVLSYSSRGLIPRETLCATCSEAFRIARWDELPHVYSTQGKGNLPGVMEWLVTLLPR
jgi:adenine-specific DNA-methyltransferase